MLSDVFKSRSSAAKEYLIILGIVVALVLFIVVYLIGSAIALLLYDSDDLGDEEEQYSSSTTTSTLRQPSGDYNGSGNVGHTPQENLKLTTLEAIRYVSNNPRFFPARCNEDILAVTGGYGFVSTSITSRVYLANFALYISFFAAFDQEEKYVPDFLSYFSLELNSRLLDMIMT